MYARWRPLDESCDHRAVFALTYLRTTEEFARTVQSDPGFFSDVPWINHEDAVFAELYFRAYDNWVIGNRGEVPAAWRVAFENASNPNLTGIGDLLLGMNAHIYRDLPYTLAAVGLVKPDGSSRKRDHDLVNAFLENVADPLQVELAQRYDPMFELTDMEPSPVDEEVVLQLVKLMRENAWRNAELLVSASSPPGARSRLGRDRARGRAVRERNRARQHPARIRADTGCTLRFPATRVRSGRGSAGRLPAWRPCRLGREEGQGSQVQVTHPARRQRAPCAGALPQAPPAPKPLSPCG